MGNVKEVYLLLRPGEVRTAAFATGLPVTGRWRGRTKVRAARVTAWHARSAHAWRWGWTAGR